VVVDAMVPLGNLSPLSTDAPVGDGNDRQPTFGDAFGEVDPGMDKVLNVETARPLKEAAPKKATDNAHAAVLRGR